MSQINLEKFKLDKIKRKYELNILVINDDERWIESFEKELNDDHSISLINLTRIRASNIQTESRLKDYDYLVIGYISSYSDMEKIYKLLKNFENFSFVDFKNTLDKSRKNKYLLVIDFLKEESSLFYYHTGIRTRPSKILDMIGHTLETLAEFISYMFRYG